MRKNLFGDRIIILHKIWTISAPNKSYLSEDADVLLHCKYTARLSTLRAPSILSLTSTMMFHLNPPIQYFGLQVVLDSVLASLIVNLMHCFTHES